VKDGETVKITADGGWLKINGSVVRQAA
jgi:hypothetical protein